MDYAEIELKRLKEAINAVLDHLIDDLKIERVTIDENQRLYWDCPQAELHNMAKKPIDFTVGNLVDDVDFVKTVRRSASGGDVSYNLVHIFPLLRYVAETIKR